MSEAPIDLLRRQFGVLVQENVNLAPHTSARIGGPADVLVTVRSAEQLAAVMQLIWEQEIPHFILGGGSNVLIADKGFRGAVILNRAREVRFENGDPATVWAEAGVVFSNLANRCASNSLGGLEWAAAVPGTVGGAVYGNAGAFGGELIENLISAELLTKHGREKFSVGQLGYGYRTSVLKRAELRGIVLSATLSLRSSTRAEASAKIAQFSADRKASQPPGASMGSMFKNPPGDHAGRLIEAAGLKSTRVGTAEISALHANFFVNHGKTRADDVRRLIDITRDAVKKNSGVELELEIELVGEWND